jgi:hypothetical protein
MAGDVISHIQQLHFEFDIQSTLSELQHDFCTLWNGIVPIAKQSGDLSVPHYILYVIRKLYFKLHKGTTTDTFDKWKVSTYPCCSDPQHRSAVTALNLAQTS